MVQKAVKPISLILLLFLPTFLMQILFLPYTTDDAYISFRYSENLVNGKGLVFNEGEQVEGFSNFLWVLICAVPIYFGFDVVVFSKLLGTIVSFMTIFIFLKFSSRFTNRPWIPTLLLSLTPSFAIWSVAGLETQLFILLLILSIYLIFEEKEILSAISFILLALTRNEGAVIAVATIIFISIYRRKIPLKLTGIFLMIYSIFFFWRWSYFGYIFPNTFYYKSSSATLIGSLNALLGFTIYMAAFIFFALHSLSKIERSNRFEIFYLLLVILLVVGISTRIGLWMPGYRLYLPILPLIYLIAEKTIPKIRSNAKVLDEKIFHLLMIVFIFILPLSSLPHLYDSTMEYATGLNSAHIPLGKWMALNLPSDASIAFEDIGSVPFYSKLETIDIVGLADEYIAHNGFSTDYLFSRNPDIIILLSSYEEIFSSRTEAGDQIYNDARLQDYDLQQVMTFQAGYHLWIFSKSYEVSL